MKRTACFVFTSLLLFVTGTTADVAQERSLVAHERSIRETYKKLELYNVAAQVFQYEQTRKPLQANTQQQRSIGKETKDLVSLGQRVEHKKPTQRPSVVSNMKPDKD